MSEIKEKKETESLKPDKPVDNIQQNDHEELKVYISDSEF